MKFKRFSQFPLSRLFIALYLGALLFAFLGCSEKPLSDAKYVVERPTAGESPGPGAFLYCTDIHFNPLFDSDLSRQLIDSDVSQWEAIFQTSKEIGLGKVDKKKEANYALLISTIKHMTRANDKPDFILFTGDFLAHNFEKTFRKHSKDGDDYHTFVDKTFEFIVMIFEKHFPDAPLYFTLGNNDSYMGNYKLKANGEFLQGSAKYMAKYCLDDDGNKNSFSKTYPEGGYYIVDPPGSEGLRIILFNSIFYSDASKATDQKEACEKQMAWFEEQLETIRQEKLKAWIVTHIPPGPDTYQCVKGKWVSQWKEEYTIRFMKLLDAYSPEIVAGFCGHTHMDDWRVLMDSQHPSVPKVYFHISPAVTAVYGNNPSFQTVIYDRGTSLQSDYTVYSLDIGAENPLSLIWRKEYSFRESYHRDEVSAAAVAKLHKAIGADPVTRRLYMEHYDAGNKTYPHMNEKTWKAYWCAHSNWEEEGFTRCLEE